MTNLSKPLRMTLTEAAAAIQDGGLASVAYTESCLTRIAALEHRIEAWAWLDQDRALALARAADRQLQERGAVGPLHGIPIGIKDIFDTKGIPTEMGSPAYRGNVPAASAAAVVALEQAGAFVMGKTVTAELAYMTPGKTRNPWNPAHTPGGSSSGSAAAVAAGFVPAALGTQTNGSVIRPAAFCGVVGYKPSQGSIARDGVLTFSPTLDQIGIFTRTVADAALVAACLVDDDMRIEPLTPLRRPPRLLAVRSPVWERADQPQRANFRDSIARLKAAGASVEEAEPHGAFARAHDAHRIIMFAEGANGFSDLQQRHRELLSPGLNALIDEGNRISATAYLEALAVRTELQRELDALLQGYDAIVTPPATGEAPAGLEQTGDPVFCTLWTLAGAPALTLPTGLGPNGLPLGLQLVARRMHDNRLLAVAHWCAMNLPFERLNAIA